MAAATFMAGGPGGRRKRSPITFGRVIAVVGVALAIAVIYNMLSWQSVSDRPNEMKTTQVILPPPPPPPPPEPEVIEQPPEPINTPIEQPVDNPPPPDQANSDPTPGDNALTAREGAGPSNYGLARGDGSGTRIGGRPGAGGDAFAAYASVALTAIRMAAQSDRELARGRYVARLAVTVDADGRITDIRVIDGTGDSRRDERLRKVLVGLQLSRRPPPGLPVMRIELNARSGA